MNSHNNNNEVLHLPSHEALGKGIGICPGRVVWNYTPEAVAWDGSGYWWKKENFNENVILNMIRDSVKVLGGKETVADGWNALFSFKNKMNGKGNVGYKDGEKIAIKVNMNGVGGYDGDIGGDVKYSFANPVLLKMLLISLVIDAGINPNNILVYDSSRIFPKLLVKMLTEEKLNGVNILFRDKYGSHDAAPDYTAPIHWSVEFEGETNYLPLCVTDADYLINMANLKGHPYGVTLCAKNHFGTLMNSSRYRPPEAANIHQFVEQREMGKYTVLVDLMSNKHLFEKTILYMLDALICTYDVMSEIDMETSVWMQPPFNGSLTSSIFMSQDPVAIDSVGIDFLTNEPTIIRLTKSLQNNFGVENYLHEAGKISCPSSQTIYLNGENQRIDNIGVHEHWNNVKDKQYGRNLGKSEGIELVKLTSQRH